MEETWKRIARWAVMAVGAVLVLIVVAVLVVQVPPIKQALLDEITEQTNEQLAGEVEIAGIGGPILWRLSLDDVRVRDARGTPVALVDKVRVGYSLLELLTGDLEIDRVGLVRPLVYAVAYPDGSYNVYEVAGSDSNSNSGGSYTISNFSVDEGAMVYDDRSEGEATGVQEAVATWVERAVASGGEFDTTPVRKMLRATGEASSGEAGMDVVLVDEVELDGELVLGPGEQRRVDLDEVTGKMYARPLQRPLPIEGDAWLLEFGPEQRMIEVEEVALAETAELSSLSVTMEPPRTDEEGDVAADAPMFRRIEGNFRTFKVTPELVGAWFPEPPLGAPVYVLGEFAGTPTQVDVDGTMTVSEGGTVEIEGSVDTTVPSYDIALGVADFQLGAWMASEVPIVRFDAKGSLVGRGVTFGEQLEASLDLTGSDIVVAGMKADRLSLDASADGQRLELDDLDIEATDYGVRAQGYRGVDGDIVLSLAARTVGREAAGRLAEELEVDPRLVGRGILELVLDEGPAFEFGAQLVPRIAPQLPFFVSTEGNYTEDYLTYALTSFEVGRPGWVWQMQEEAKASIEEEYLTLESLVVERGDQSVRLDGTYDLRDASSLAGMFKKLTEGPLNKLFDLGELRKRFPRLMLDRPAEELRKRMPEELERRLPEGPLPEKLRDFIAP